MNNKILIIFPDGVGIKNYLYSNTFQNVNLDLVLFHNFDSHAIDELKKQTNFFDEVSIPDYKESIKELFLRELICLSRLKNNSKLTKNNSILTNWNWHQTKVPKKIFYKLIAFVSLFYSNNARIRKLENKYQNEIRKNSFFDKAKEILKEINPQYVFCAHQRGLKMATIFAAASDLGIQTTTVIYSWDNLPKARMALRADIYLVWSDYMKQEMKLYYPEINQDNVIVTGTPQFEFYENKQNLINKEIFYNKYKLDLNKKIICFSGDDEKTSPDDPKYLDDIAQAIVTDGLEEQYQILFRRCPVDLSGRFDDVIIKYNTLIKEVPPLWYFNDPKNWTTVFPNKEDIKLLVSTAYYSDVVVNVGSTMAFDFAMYSKPCIFIDYDQENKLSKNWSTKTIYSFQHFKSMPNSKAVYWLRDKVTIMSVIQQSLSENNTLAMDEWKKVVLGDYKNASKKILENF